MTPKHLDYSKKYRRILDAAIELALEVGYLNIKRNDIAKKAKVSKGTVHYYFLNMEALREEIMREAVFKKIVPIVATGLMMNHPIALLAPTSLRKKAAKYIVKLPINTK